MKVHSVIFQLLAFSVSGASAVKRPLHQSVARTLGNGLSFVVIRHGNDDLSTSVSFSIVPDGFRNLT